MFVGRKEELNELTSYLNSDKQENIVSMVEEESEKWIN